MSKKGSLSDLLTQLESHEPGSRSAEKRRAELEHQLMQIVLADGLPGVRRLVKTLGADGAFEPVFATGSVRTWRRVVDDRIIELQTNTGRVIKSASIRYSRRPRSSVSPRERARHAMQQRFYARYGEVGAAGSLARSRLSSSDRLVRSIGDLEADLNNGGFGQYLGNKGRRQATRVLAQLRSIGAPRTAALLQSALRNPTDSSKLGRLDTAYYRRPEDLACLVMRFLRKRLLESEQR